MKATVEADVVVEHNDLDHLFRVEVHGAVVDNGIGAYEYWGSRGFDSHKELEVDWIDNVKLHSWQEFDNGRPVDPEKFNPALKAAYDKAIKKLDMYEVFDGAFGRTEDDY